MVAVAGCRSSSALTAAAMVFLLNGFRIEVPAPNRWAWSTLSDSEKPDEMIAF
jgi:hypothetical protein